MIPEPGFFALQLAFAQRWAALAGTSLGDAALETTTWYHHVGRFGRDFDAAHPGWVALVQEVIQADDPGALLHARLAQAAPSTASGPVMDFSWDAESSEIRLRFETDRAPDGPSPLAVSALEERRREVRELVERAGAAHPDARWIRGRSWLYSLEAYRRIFPPAFVARLSREPHDLQFLACWGQFVDRRGRVRQAAATTFLAGVGGAESIEALLDAFPMPMLETRMGFDDFAAGV